MSSKTSVDSKCECSDPCLCPCLCNPCRCGCGCDVPCPCLWESYSDKVRFLKKKEKCSTNVATSKYERTDNATQQWWNQQFDDLEEKKRMPFHKRLEHLEQVFSHGTIKKLIEGGCEVHLDWGLDLEKEKAKSIIEHPPEHRLYPKKGFKKHEENKAPVEEYTNPYLNFFRKSPRNAQVWRPRPPPPIDKLPLIQKAKHLEEKLATEFDEWFSNVGSKTKSEIDKDVILSIFEIVMSYPIVTSINCQIFEVGAVPAHTAQFLGYPERGEGASVQKEIKKDIRAGKKKSRLVAFSKTLPTELRQTPFIENLKEKWFEYQIRHNDIQTMASVWRGITELQTTRAFINFILDCPEIVHPPYLRDEGCMKMKLHEDKRQDDINFDYLEAELDDHDRENLLQEHKL